MPLMPDLSHPALRPWHPVPWLVALATAALTAQAASPARAGKHDPLDPKAPVPALAYTSSLKPDVRPAGDGPISWREANDTVARIGGWRVYAREAQKPDPDPAPAPLVRPPLAVMPPALTVPAQPLPASPALPQGHGGHKKP